MYVTGHASLTVLMHTFTVRRKKIVFLYKVCLYLNLIANDAERNGAISQLRASFHSHIGNQNNALYRKLMIFPVLLTEQKMFPLALIVDIRDEQARPGPVRHGPSVTLFEGLFLSHF